MTEDLTYITATEALARFRAKTLSPVDLMRAVIDRAEATQPTINALTYTYYDEAMDAARAAEARWAKGAPAGPLDGLPLAAKDENFIKGLPTSNGSLLMKDYVAEFTSPVLQRILDAGAIIHARTATPEFSMAGVTWSRLWGVTRNPWNTDLTPGGSSGGSGAALAAGATILATGSDIGGSIRIPASCCGVVGFKPPYGRNPEDPPLNLDPYCHNGPMARSVGDAILLQNVMCGPHPHDIATIRPKLTLPDAYDPIAGWRIALSYDYGFKRIDPAVRANLDRAAEVFRSLGATVEEVDLGWDESVIDAALGHLSHLFGGFGGQFLDQADLMTPYARHLSENSKTSTAADFVATMQKATEMYATFGPLMERYDLFICPTTALPAVAADHDPTAGAIEVDGVPVDPRTGWVMTMPFNTLSRCPVLALPTGFAPNCAPTGMQLVGRTFRDEDVMRAGMAYEAATGGFFGSDARPPRA